MRGIRHPYSHALYEPTEDDLVQVTAADGRTGRFRRDGVWIDGELREADPHLCGWIAGPRFENHRVGTVPIP